MEELPGTGIGTMKQIRTSHDDFESSLLDAVRADECGVFNPTPIDAEALLAATPSSGSYGWFRAASMVAPLAACIALSFAIARVWLSAPADVPTGTPLSTQDLAGSGVNGAANSGDFDCYDFDTFSNCFTGPAGDQVSNGCVCVDFDRDGDVDFADFGVLQQTLPASRG